MLGLEEGAEVNMLEEATKLRVRNNGVERGVAAVQVIQAPAEPEHIYYVAYGNKVTRKEAEPKPRNHIVFGIKSLVKICEEFAAGGSRVSVWYSRLGITAFLDDEQRRDKVQMPLEVSRQMNQLAEWRQVTWMEKEDLLRTLRIVFNVYAHGSLADALLAMSGYRQTQPDESKEGRGGLPTEIMLHVPAFRGRTLDAWALVECLVEVDDKGRVAIITKEDSLHIAWDDVEDQIEKELMNEFADELLKDSRIHIYRGVP